MRIGIHTPARLPQSMKIYSDHIVKNLTSKGVAFVSIADQRDLAAHKVDLYWDPGCGGGSPPTALFRQLDKPAVATVHGADVFSLPLKVLHPNRFKAIRHKLSCYTRYDRWRFYGSDQWTIITVSKFAEAELRQHLPLKDHAIFPIYHGLDHNVFRPASPTEATSYLLHISQFIPKKNIYRIIEAYHRLKLRSEIRLLIVSPQFPLEDAGKGIDIQRRMQTHLELVHLYQNALGFVFPSLHESFGFPIVEAMACGCPVITSNSSACAEIAGDAALLVDPYTVDAIADAMGRLIDDAGLRAALREKGIQRATMFSWETCADQHLQVFQSVLNRLSA